MILPNALATHRIDESSLAIYLREIGKYTLLSPEEEIELARRIRRGDAQALNMLTAANLRFVVKIAKAYQNRGLSLADLINEGNVGLLKAAKRFDERRGIRFISYAVWWIRQTILKALAEQSKIVRLPLNKAGRIRKIAKASMELSQAEGRPPTLEEIAKKLDLEEKEVADAVAISKSDLSLDAPLSSIDDNSFVNLLDSAAYPSPEEFMFQEAFKEEMHRAIKTLSPREAEIVTLYFGIGSNRPHTLEEIGTMMDLSRERVRQIKQQALKRLRCSPDAGRLRAYLN